MWRTIAMIIATFLLLSGHALSQPEKRQSAEVVAKGDGFHITRADVNAMKDYFQKRTPFRTTEDEYLRYTVQVHLFAKEALAKGMANDMDIDPANLTVEDVLTLSQRYMRRVFDQYPVDDLVLESYYRAFPEKFLKSQEVMAQEPTRKQVLRQEQLVPFEEARGRIRQIILSGIQKKVVSEAYQGLVKKYNVTFHVNRTGAQP